MKIRVIKRKVARRLGRPSSAETQKLNEHLLDVAERLFLARGFEGTSMDTMALVARASKRTIYHRYPSKDVLFEAVIERAIDRILEEAGKPAVGATLEVRLEQLALNLIEPSLQAHWPALLRTIIAGASRFPRLALSFDQRIRSRVFTLVSENLEREVRDGTLVLRWPMAVSAEQFVDIAVIGYILRRLLGVDPDLLRAEAGENVSQSVKTFLEGSRPSGAESA